MVFITNILNNNFKDSIIFDKVSDKKSKEGIEWKQINISARDESGNVGPLYISLPKNCKSWGINNKAYGEDKIAPIGRWTISAKLYNSKPPSEDEVAFVKGMEDFFDFTKDHILSVKKDLKKFGLDKSDLKGIGSFMRWSYNKETGDVDSEKGPTIYAKLMYDSRQNSITTSFVENETWRCINPNRLVSSPGKLCACVMKIQSIYIGTKICIQARIVDAIYELENSCNNILSLGLIPNAPTKPLSDIDEENEEPESSPVLSRQLGEERIPVMIDDMY